MSSKGAKPQNSGESSPGGSNERALSEREYDDYLTVDQDKQSAADDRDLVLNVPEAKVEELNLEVESLNARISLQAELADIVKINVGFDVDLDQVKLAVKGVEAEASLEARLENVREIFGKVMDAVSTDPQVLEGFVRMMEGSSRVLAGAAGKVGATDSSGTEEARTDESQTEASRDENTESTDEVNATEAAWKKADELGMRLRDVKGTGSGGRVVLKDVIQAAQRR